MKNVSGPQTTILQIYTRKSKTAGGVIYFVIFCVRFCYTDLSLYYTVLSDREFNFVLQDNSKVY
jgi:hypothetical protein